MIKKKLTIRKVLITLEVARRSICPSPGKVGVLINKEERAAVIPQEEVVQDLIIIHTAPTNREITITINITILEDLIDIRKHRPAIMR